MLIHSTIRAGRHEAAQGGDRRQARPRPGLRQFVERQEGGRADEAGHPARQPERAADQHGVVGVDDSWDARHRGRRRPAQGPVELQRGDVHDVLRHLRGRGGAGAGGRGPGERVIAPGRPKPPGAPRG